MEFCPGCGNMLQYELLNMHDARFFCPTCPYVAYVDRKVKTKRRQHLVKKEIQPILTLDDYKNVPKTEAGNCFDYTAVAQQSYIPLSSILLNMLLSAQTSSEWSYTPQPAVEQSNSAQPFVPESGAEATEEGYALEEEGSF
ncbi:hypothetical protein ACFX13_018973 [Malus domestica]